MTTRTDIDALEALEKKATQGPWERQWIDDPPEVEGDIEIIGPPPMTRVALVEGRKINADDTGSDVRDAEFIVAARSALPALLRELRAARAVVEACRNGTMADLDYALDAYDAAVAGEGT